MRMRRQWSWSSIALGLALLGCGKEEAPSSVPVSTVDTPPTTSEIPSPEASNKIWFTKPAPGEQLHPNEVIEFEGRYTVAPGYRSLRDSPQVKIMQMARIDGRRQKVQAQGTLAKAQEPETDGSVPFTGTVRCREWPGKFFLEDTIVVAPESPMKPDSQEPTTEDNHKIIKSPPVDFTVKKL